jgi:4-carboxymuconolactone decarboxylase
VSRLPGLRPDQLDAAQRAIYDDITTGPRAQGPQHFALTREDGSLSGPFNALLFSPVLGGAVQALGAAVRYATALSARERELAILVVAAHWDSAFERHAHEAVGRAAGLTDDELAAVRDGGVPELVDPREAAIVALAHAMARGDVDDALWASSRALLSPETVVEVSTLVGYYALLALQLRVFRVDRSA